MRSNRDFSVEQPPPNSPANENGSLSQWREARILVLGTTYPHYSETYTENVCTGGILEDTRALVRVHPLPQRYLEPEHRPHAFQWITVEYQRHQNDPRPESVRVRPDTIRCGDAIPSRAHDERRTHIEGCTGVFSSVEEVKRAWESNGTSLAIIRPAEILGVRLEKRGKSEARVWRSKARAAMSQQRMHSIIGSVKPIDFPEMRFMVRWRCDDRSCNGHEMGLESWDIHERWRKLFSDPDREQKILTTLQTRLDLEKRDLYFYLGNFRGIQWNFGLMGVCSLPKKVAQKQMSFVF
jgi:hypothetical protein